MSKQWNCPLCWKRCDYDTNGCDDPLTCDEPKNINWYQVYKARYESKRGADDGHGVGISEIANEGL